MGGGGGSYFPTPKPDLEELIRRTKQEADQKRLDGDVNKLLRELLASCERDPEQVRQHLDRIEDVLKGEADIEQFLFGGSVAKHTYVDGLSDIDALVVLDRSDLVGKPPQAILDTLSKLLSKKLYADTVKSIEKGRLAVTVTCQDGLQIQLLPATKTGTKISIPDAGGRRWNETKPRLFQRALTKANARLNQSLVPVIKLAKSINSSLPKQRQLEGYHIEALALEAVKGYQGSSTPKALLVRFFDQAATRVLRPIADITGQSRVVDEYLGKADSPKRKSAANALRGIAQKLNSATSVDQWESLLEA